VVRYQVILCCLPVQYNTGHVCSIIHLRRRIDVVEKNSVVQKRNLPASKSRAARSGHKISAGRDATCPNCGRAASRSGQVLKCPSCGTLPWE
jgi:rubrerythrin